MRPAADTLLGFHASVLITSVGIGAVLLVLLGMLVHALRKGGKAKATAAAAAKIERAPSPSAGGKGKTMDIQKTYESYTVKAGKFFKKGEEVLAAGTQLFAHEIGVAGRVLEKDFAELLDIGPKITLGGGDVPMAPQPVPPAAAAPSS